MFTGCIAIFRAYVTHFRGRRGATAPGGSLPRNVSRRAASARPTLAIHPFRAFVFFNFFGHGVAQACSRG